MRQLINYLTETAAKRLNIIRVLSHKSWKLDQSTLIQIYNTLIRSLFDYSSIFSSALSELQINKLQIIQNNALRAILKKKRDTKIKVLHQLTNCITIKDRLKNLSSKYITSNILNENPIIVSTVEEFINFKQARKLNFKTLLCDYYSEN